jgi:YXWGXW repeat-containing protein
MKKLWTIPAVLLLGVALATPATAGHYGHPGGHSHHSSHGTFLGIASPPLPHLPLPRLPLPHFYPSFSVSLGVPLAAPTAYYAPAPAYYYVPAPVYVPPPPVANVWIPGRYVWSGGAQVYIAGHWSYRH